MSERPYWDWDPPHEENLKPGDMVATDLGENYRRPFVITGLVAQVNDDTGEMRISLGEGAFLIRKIECVQSLMRATRKLWPPPGTTRRRLQ